MFIKYDIFIYIPHSEYCSEHITTNTQDTHNAHGTQTYNMYLNKDYICVGVSRTYTRPHKITFLISKLIRDRGYDDDFYTIIFS